MKYKYPNDAEKIRVPNTLGTRPNTFEIDCLVQQLAHEIKWRDATTDEDHITKEHVVLILMNSSNNLSHFIATESENVIKANTHKYAVLAMCKVLQIPRSAYYYEAKQKPEEDSLTSGNYLGRSGTTMAPVKSRQSLRKRTLSFHEDELEEL